MNNLKFSTEHKKHHEMFVSGHNGSDTLEISLVASAAPLSLLLFKVVMLFLVCNKTRFLKKFLLEFVILIGCTLLSLTKLADQPTAFLGLMSACCITIIFLVFQHERANRIEIIGDDDSFDGEAANIQKVVPNRPEFVSNYRAYVNVATSICILAVDFQIFPRRFCKTETFGTGLMDMGVGSFVVSNGIISREARGCFQRPDKKPLLTTLMSTWPLILLGMSRVLTLKVIGYPEHVSEYGMHWNFFFTLAIVKIFSSILFSVFSVKHSLLVAVFISGTYELLLHFTGLSDYLLSEGNRVGLIHSNREGFCSVLGYLALYLVSIWLGSIILNERHSNGKVSYKSTITKCLKLFALDGILWMLLYHYQIHISPVSRRMANFPYVIWMLAYNIQMLISFLAVDIVTSFVYTWADKDGANPSETLLEAINSNGLAFFLLSNLLTGAVNVVMNTIDADDVKALGVLTLYMFCLTVFVRLLHHFNIKLKFW